MPEIPTMQSADITPFQYIDTLQAFLDSPHGDARLKKWARLWLDEVTYQEKMILKQAQTRQCAAAYSYTP